MSDLSDGFRQAMRRLASTVALITAGKGDDRSGMAATALVSVCADPPTLLIAVNRSASIHGTLTLQSRYCVNLLSDRHRDLVAAFSGALKGLDRFGMGAWSEGPDGIPMLSDAMACLVCRTTSRLDIGTHTLFVGEVEHIENHPDIAPLLWVDGGFAHAEQVPREGLTAS